MSSLKVIHDASARVREDIESLTRAIATTVDADRLRQRVMLCERRIRDARENWDIDDDQQRAMTDALREAAQRTNS